MLNEKNLINEQQALKLEKLKQKVNKGHQWSRYNFKQNTDSLEIWSK